MSRLAAISSVLPACLANCPKRPTTVLCLVRCPQSIHLNQDGARRVVHRVIRRMCYHAWRGFKRPVFGCQQEVQCHLPGLGLDVRLCTGHSTRTPSAAIRVASSVLVGQSAANSSAVMAIGTIA